jgi:hypothetical protein
VHHPCHGARLQALPRHPALAAFRDGGVSQSCCHGVAERLAKRASVRSGSCPSFRAPLHHLAGFGPGLHQKTDARRIGTKNALRKGEQRFQSSAQTAADGLVAGPDQGASERRIFFPILNASPLSRLSPTRRALIAVPSGGIRSALVLAIMRPVLPAVKHAARGHLRARNSPWYSRVHAGNQRSTSR